MRSYDRAQCSPFSAELKQASRYSDLDVLETEQQWWKTKGTSISDAIDRAGAPWLRMFDKSGKRVDEILFPCEYQTILRRGCRLGLTTPHA